MLRSKVENILAVLDRAKTPGEANLPGFRLHELTGSLSGFWSISVNKNWRITFRLVDGEAHDVDLVDYH